MRCITFSWEARASRALSVGSAVPSERAALLENSAPKARHVDRSDGLQASFAASFCRRLGALSRSFLLLVQAHTFGQSLTSCFAIPFFVGLGLDLALNEELRELAPLRFAFERHLSHLKPGSSLPQNLVQCLSLCELINELVQVANLLHERVLNFLHANAAHHAFDERSIRIDPWRLGEESLQVVFGSYLVS